MDIKFNDMDKEDLVRIIESQDEKIKRLTCANDTLEKKINEAQLMANIGLWEWDAKNNITTWSDQSYRIHDLPIGSEVNYETILARVHPEDRGYHTRLTSEWIKNKGGEPYEYRIVDGNDEIRHIRAYGKVECNEAGEVVRFIGALQNITDIKELQENSEKALTSVISGFIPICIYCKAIRNKTDKWESLEKYVSHKSKATFSHGICPDCTERAKKDFGFS